MRTPPFTGIGECPIGREKMNPHKHSRLLAGEIQKRWRALGYRDVRVWLEAVPGSGHHQPDKPRFDRVIEICSNLINGLPPSAFPYLKPRKPGEGYVK